jgi:hypothetical protein
MTSPAAPPILYNTGREETMSGNPQDDAILSRFRAALSDVYGDRLEWVVRYGSRARRSSFIDEGYQFKSIADYGVGPAIDEIAADDATSAIDIAALFIDTIALLLPP